MNKPIVAAAVVVAALGVASGTAGAASTKAGCVGQFFAQHAGLVPATGGEESVGGFIRGAAQELGRDFGGEISGATSNPRNACGL